VRKLQEPTNKGRKFSDKWKRNLSLSHKGKNIGSNNHLWKGGITKNKKEYQRICNVNRRCLNLKVGYMKRKTVQLVYEVNIRKYGTLTCEYCSGDLDFGNDSIDHKTPLIRGGTNEFENLFVSCRLCNSRKNRKTEEEYRSSL